MARDTNRSDRQRTARVQITYDLEVDGEMRRKELPFVIGVLGDFSGQPLEPLPKLRDRKFVDVGRDNFDAALKGAKPRLAFRVPNRLTSDESKLAIELQFQKLEDFEPDAIVRQVEALRKLAEARHQLSTIRAALDRGDATGKRLRELVAPKRKEAERK
jgi:type VI secretion system protein ImpB